MINQIGTVYPQRWPALFMLKLMFLDTQGVLVTEAAEPWGHDIVLAMWRIGQLPGFTHGA